MLVTKHLRFCAVAAALIALHGPVYAADDALGRETPGTAASETSGTSQLGTTADPVVGASVCPAPSAIWQELVTLVPHERLISRLRALGKANGSIRVEDLGTTFRISVHDKTREYREEERDCAHRAREGALFAALIIDPAALISSGAFEKSPCPCTQVTKTFIHADVSASPVSAHVPFVRLDVGPSLLAGLSGQDRTTHWGGSIRFALGRGAISYVFGVEGLWPTDTSMGGVHLRQWRLPVDAGIRATFASTSIDLYGELGLAFALLSVRALDLGNTKSQMGMELGGRAGLGVRLARQEGFTPFASIQAEVVPDPPSVVALPAGLLGHTPYLWMGACVGASWGIR